MRKRPALWLALILVLSVGMTGCTFIYQKRRSQDVEKISQLQSRLSEMQQAKIELENRLRNEINDKQVKIQMMQRGLVITFVSEVLFNSGKAKLRPGSFDKLAKVAQILNTTVRDLNVGIEGYTDNVPIKHSGWKSNWELSTARALSVLHYLVNKQNVDPDRLAAIGYGPYHPVASNATKEGRQKNRRVEIVILPKFNKQNAVQSPAAR